MTTVLSSLTLLSSVRCGGHSLFDLWKLQYPLVSTRKEQQRLISLILQIDHESIPPLAARCSPAPWKKGKLHLFNNVALLSLSHALSGSEG